MIIEYTLTLLVTLNADIRTKHNSVNDTEPKYPPYQLATATMGCQTWDDGAETWRTDECKVKLYHVFFSWNLLVGIRNMLLRCISKFHFI